MPVTILPQTLKQPLSFMGECAGPAYGSDTSNPEKKNYRRGLTCVKDGHGRMLEFCDVFLKLKDTRTSYARVHAPRRGRSNRYSAFYSLL